MRVLVRLSLVGHLSVTWPVMISCGPTALVKSGGTCATIPRAEGYWCVDLVFPQPGQPDATAGLPCRWRIQAAVHRHLTIPRHQTANSRNGTGQIRPAMESDNLCPSRLSRRLLCETRAVLGIWLRINGMATDAVGTLRFCINKPVGQKCAFGTFTQYPYRSERSVIGQPACYADCEETHECV